MINQYPKEDAEQAAVIQWCQYIPEVRNRIFAVPNGTFLAGDKIQRAKQMARLKAQGLRPDVSDLFLPLPKGDYSGLWIEMKRVRAAKPAVRAGQVAWLDLMSESGYCSALCYGADDAINVIKLYLQCKPTTYRGFNHGTTTQKRKKKDSGEENRNSDHQYPQPRRRQYRDKAG